MLFLVGEGRWFCVCVCSEPVNCAVIVCCLEQAHCVIVRFFLFIHAELSRVVKGYVCSC